MHVLCAWTHLPSLVAYGRPRNIRDKRVRSKIPTIYKRNRLTVPGMRKCNKCTICPFVKEGKRVPSTSSKCPVDINTSVNCHTKNIFYCISWDKCSLQFIGESEQTLKVRFSEHEHKVNVSNSIRNKATRENRKGTKLKTWKSS